MNQALEMDGVVCEGVWNCEPGAGDGPVLCVRKRGTANQAREMDWCSV